MQANKLIHLYLSEQEDVALYRVRAYESISALFQFDLEIKSLGGAQLAAHWLGKRLGFQIEDQCFHGEVFGFTELGLDSYQLKLLPSMAKLDRYAESRIYHSRSTLDIVREVLQDYRVDFSGLRKQYELREYCVQYQETPLKFLERLLAEEGISYFFHFTYEQHSLVLVDQMATQFYKTKLRSGNQQRACSTWNWVEHYKHGADRITLMDDNPHLEQQVLQLSHDLCSEPLLGIFERKIYPGGYNFYKQGWELLNSYSKSYTQTKAWVSASSNYSGLHPYQLIESEHDPDTNYLLTEIWHHAEDLSYKNCSTAALYSNRFNAIKAIYFRPPIPGKQKIKYIQFAKVVGGEEQTPTYTENAQIFLQFSWDQAKIAFPARVAQWWALPQAGMQFFPRVGEMVLVYFIHGDPERPMAWSALTNKKQAPLYAENNSGFRSQHDESFTELRFDDSIEQASLNWHAAGDFKLSVGRDAVLRAEKHNMSLSEGEAKVEVGENYLLEATEFIEFQVGHSRLQINTEKIILTSPCIKLN